jgi:hypothetical protein
MIFIIKIYKWSEKLELFKEWNTELIKNYYISRLI